MFLGVILAWSNASHDLYGILNPENASHVTGQVDERQKFQIVSNYFILNY